MRAECTCTFVEPVRGSAVLAGGPSRYVTYLDFVEDATEFDPACPYHGEGGSMVARVSPSGRRSGGGA